MRKKDLIFFVIILAGAALDQITKAIARHYLPYRHSIPVIPYIFDLTLTYNTGAAFGIFKGMNLMFVLFAFIVLGIFLLNYRKMPSIAGSALIVAGLIGNLIDRIFLGHVTDFLDFRVWPIFNVADMCVSIGVVLLLYVSYKHDKKNKNQSTQLHG